MYDVLLVGVNVIVVMVGVSVLRFVGLDFIVVDLVVDRVLGEIITVINLGVVVIGTVVVVGIV